ncbi:hypothetical protein JN27_08740 [Massilia sp. BSC265]|nr:hypothetical protein JN27_08740 [Massilia sp. BSC265]
MSLALLSLPPIAGAETLSFEGRIPSSRAVVRIPITLANPLSGVIVWTDSYAGGQAFDPITALWRDGVLLGENDDGPGLMPGQSWFDSGLRLGTLEAGDYLLTITNFNNFANGSLLADGFRFDDPLYPALNLNNCFGSDNCPGNFWRVHLQDGFMPPAVPEPAHALLFAAGTAVLAAARRRRIRSSQAT